MVNECSRIECSRIEYELKREEEAQEEEEGYKTLQRKNSQG